jgi:hypothetical protein
VVVVVVVEVVVVVVVVEVVSKSFISSKSIAMSSLCSSNATVGASNLTFVNPTNSRPARTAVFKLSSMTSVTSSVSYFTEHCFCASGNKDVHVLVSHADVR